MNNSDDNAFLLTIGGHDKAGVVAEITSYLFESGGNLADTAFAVLGEAFEFGAVVIFSQPNTESELQDGLASLESLADARITVSPFPFGLMRNEVGTVTHVIEFTGGDRPGLVAGMAEELATHGANIVRMNSRRVDGNEGDYGYRTRFAVNLPADRATVCCNAVSNLAGSLDLACGIETT